MNEFYRKFIRTPVRWENGEVNPKATYDDPKKLFPDSYVDYIGVQYGKEEDTTKGMISIYPHCVENI